MYYILGLQQKINDYTKFTKNFIIDSLGLQLFHTVSYSIANKTDVEMHAVSRSGAIIYNMTLLNSILGTAH